MAHELDITNDVASFANSRADAWHRLGQSVGHTMTAREALAAAHLANWNERKCRWSSPRSPSSRPTAGGVVDQFTGSNVWLFTE